MTRRELAALGLIGAVAAVYPVASLAFGPLLEPFAWRWQVIILLGILWHLHLGCLFPVIIACLAGRRAIFYGVLSCFVLSAVQRATDWNPQQYPGGRWDFFWALEAKPFAWLLVWAAFISLPVHLLQVQQATQPQRTGDEQVNIEGS